MRTLASARASRAGDRGSRSRTCDFVWDYETLSRRLINAVGRELFRRGRRNTHASRVRSPGNLASQRGPIGCFIMRMKRFLILHVFGSLLVTMAHGATSFELAAKATNELGVNLHRQLATGDENLCISPYSIDSALAMTFAGADGETRTEMARVLHFPVGQDVPPSFSA